MPAQLRKAVPKGTQASQELQTRVKQLFVGGMGLDLKADDLRAYFSQFGEVTDAQVWYSSCHRMFAPQNSADRGQACRLHSLTGYDGPKHWQISRVRFYLNGGY